MVKLESRRSSQSRARKKKTHGLSTRQAGKCILSLQLVELLATCMQPVKDEERVELAAGS